MNTEERERTKETNRLGFKCVREIIEFNCTPLILTVSWVLTSGVVASTPILSSVTLSVFVAVTDSPGVTHRLQCTIGHLCSVPSGSQLERQHSPITPLKPSISHSLGTPCGVYYLSIGPELRDSANGQMILLSL